MSERPLWHAPDVRTLEPPVPSRRLYWSIVATSAGLFAALAASHLILGAPTEDMIADGRLLTTLAVEVLLAAAWVPVLVRRGWTLRCATRPAALLDLVRGVGLFVLAYLAYWFLYSVAAAALPSFSALARGTVIGGAPSWWVVVLVSLLNPVAEEFLYLGFITNLSKGDGYQAAIVAGVLARVAIHVYQGPVGVVAAVAVGVSFGVYYLRTGRLWPIVVAHGFADLIALGSLTTPSA
jgi:uncharacterized protein